MRGKIGRNLEYEAIFKRNGRLTLHGINQKSFNNAIKSARNANDQQYRVISVIGKGAFGVVCLGKWRNGQTVAIKKALYDQKYINREHDILKMLNHPNCVKLFHYFISKEGKKQYSHYIMEYVPTDLNEFALSFRAKHVYCPLISLKVFGFQLFCGLNYIHSLGITHRDLKPQNILVDEETGILKICDFGSAKIISKNESSVSYIASRYYRAPELLMNCSFYGPPIDIWAAGCSLVELLMSGTPIFSGKTNLDVLKNIVNIIGHPRDEDYGSFQHTIMTDKSWMRTKSIRLVLPEHTPESFIDLISKIFVYDPNKRLTARECMDHPFFDDLFTNKITLLPNNIPIPKLSRD